MALYDDKETGFATAGQVVLNIFATSLAGNPNVDFGLRDDKSEPRDASSGMLFALDQVPGNMSATGFTKCIHETLGNSEFKCTSCKFCCPCVFCTGDRLFKTSLCMIVINFLSFNIFSVNYTKDQSSRAG